MILVIVEHKILLVSCLYAICMICQRTDSQEPPNFTIVFHCVWFLTYDWDETEKAVFTLILWFHSSLAEADSQLNSVLLRNQSGWEKIDDTNFINVYKFNWITRITHCFKYERNKLKFMYERGTISNIECIMTMQPLEGIKFIRAVSYL